jgi:phage gp45-like
LKSIKEKVMLGVLRSMVHPVALVTTSSSIALASNGDRVYALFINDSDTVIYLSLGATAVVNQGIRINANGGSYEMSEKAGNLYMGVIYAIHGGSGTKKLLVTEGS